MKASELLENAAIKLRKAGHCKGRMFDAVGRMCIRGAVKYSSNYGLSEWRAIKFLEGVTGGRPSGWNDETETTHGAAVSALMAARKLALEAGE